MQFPNGSQTLLTFAEAYFHLGYSVIPLLGNLDPARPKNPALPWSGFQHHHAVVNDYKQWFSESGFAGLGIVTGRISKLVVLDFDSDTIFNTFKARYPDLLETHTVHSAGRSLSHLYFKLPDHLHIESRKGQGIDLLSEGRYVVAPPTNINGRLYQVTRGAIPKTLTERDIRRLQAFLNGQQTRLPVPTAQPQRPFIAAAVSSPKPTTKDLENLYRYHCQKSGRNEALFHTSLYARDAGWTALEAQQCLVNLHSQQPARVPQPVERPAQRQREALKTIQSAFSRPACSPKMGRGSSNDRLSNSVREALLRQGMTSVVRTYEGLAQAGIRPGQITSMKNAVQILKGVVGRDSVLKALKTQHNGQRLFAPATPVSPHYAGAADHSLSVSKNAFLILCKNQEKVGMGRPQHFFVLPTNAALCRLLEVTLTSSDPLSHEDLASARQTRMALHRELIKRRPGSYPQRWLAKRLGVSKRTLNTYNQLIPIHSRAMFLETPINWKTIQRLPFDEPLQGAFLQTKQGKKYPALRPLASRLLANGESLCLSQRTVSFYWYGDVEPPMAGFVQIGDKHVQKQATQETFLAQTSRSKSVETQPKLLQQPLLKPVGADKTPHKNVPKPFADVAQEALA